MAAKLHFVAKVMNLRWDSGPRVKASSHRCVTESQSKSHTAAIRGHSAAAPSITTRNPKKGEFGMSTNRRNLLKLLGAAAAASGFPASVARALAIPANNRTASIQDIEYIVILMQENRSFDHYFGTLRGVRGFSDPRAVKLPSGKSVWHQPDAHNPHGYVLPFWAQSSNLGSTFIEDTPHDWNGTHAAWNGGNYDQWVPNKGTPRWPT